MCDLDQARRLPTKTEPPHQPPIPDVFMPAMPPLGLINALETWVRTRVRDMRRRREFRQRFLPLLAYDDHILEDMGHCREEIEWAAHLPLKEDADQALLHRRARRRGTPA